MRQLLIVAFVVASWLSPLTLVNAQTSDPFQSEVPERPPEPKRRPVVAPVRTPAPRVAVAPAPAAPDRASPANVVANPAPAAVATTAVSAANIATASRAYSGLFERISERARANQLPVPDSINFVTPTPDVPPAITRFFGAWGPANWGLTSVILVVYRVDATGTADVLLLENGCDNGDCTRRSAKLNHFNAKVVNGALSFMSLDNKRQLKFAFDLVGWLQGDVAGIHGGGRRAVFRRIE